MFKNGQSSNIQSHQEQTPRRPRWSLRQLTKSLLRRLLKHRPRLASKKPVVPSTSPTVMGSPSPAPVAATNTAPTTAPATTSATTPTTAPTTVPTTTVPTTVPTTPLASETVPVITVTEASSQHSAPRDVPKIAITIATPDEIQNQLIRNVSPTVYFPDMAPLTPSSLASSSPDKFDTVLTPAPPKRSGRVSSSNRPPTVGLARQQTYTRQKAERRENLSEVVQTLAERRAISADRRVTLSRASSRVASREQLPSQSEPILLMPGRSQSMTVPTGSGGTLELHPLGSIDNVLRTKRRISGKHSTPRLSEKSELSLVGTEVSAAPSSPFLDPPLSEAGEDVGEDARIEGEEAVDEDEDDMISVTSDIISEELETRWILNLSMTFRDGTPREKFFVTFLDGSHWRRVTISLDYRDCEEGSLEDDLSRIHSQREKSRRIYIEVRSSLDQINFFDTVTNLRLETKEKKLHIHVAQDANEIITYPTTNQLQYLGCDFVKSRDVKFESHTSGFVYRVTVDDRLMIKKEIPGRESVDEFLYEINALHSLIPSPDVVDFIGLVYDDEDPEFQDVDYKPVTGLLIAYASRGALVDFIYDNQIEGCHLPLALRIKWARQIVQGLSEIHEAGFVQGDFTLANIVIDDYEDAKIIDINRRGCPVGWEPPEATPIIRTKQRLNMYIGVKSDIFQLGMVLWALATQEDEPERFERPLQLDDFNNDTPEWYRDVVNICLSPNPKNRLQATSLLSLFPREEELIIPYINTLAPHPHMYNYSESDYSELEDRRGRSPMEFGQPTVRNPLVMTSPPSLADSSDLGDREESNGSAISFATTTRDGLMSPPAMDFPPKSRDFEYEFFESQDMSVLADRGGGDDARREDCQLADVGYIHEDDDERMSDIGLGLSVYDISAVTDVAGAARPDEIVEDPENDPLSDTDVDPQVDVDGDSNKENKNCGPAPVRGTAAKVEKSLEDSGVVFEEHETQRANSSSTAATLAVSMEEVEKGCQIIKAGIRRERSPETRPLADITGPTTGVGFCGLVLGGDELHCKGFFTPPESDVMALRGTTAGHSVASESRDRKVSDECGREEVEGEFVKHGDLLRGIGGGGVFEGNHASSLTLTEEEMVR